MPDWLPPMLTVDPWQDATWGMLYAVFCRDIKNSRLYYKGHHVWFFPDKEDGKEILFWHLTGRKNKSTQAPRRMRHFYPNGIIEAERLPNFPRSARLTWVRPLIEHPDDPEVLAWDHKEDDGVIKTYVWLKAYDFVVIMKKNPDDTRRLITSYFVDEDYMREDFEKKWKKRIQG